MSVPIAGKDRDFFVQSRNKLVHEGRYYTEAESDAVAGLFPAGPKSPLEELLFLTAFVDKVILSAVGYRS